MGAWPQRHIDGFQVQCEIVTLDTEVLAIEITVSRQDNSDFRKRWSLPRFVTFNDANVARRHAELVLSGIVSINESTGEPRYGFL